MIYSKEEKIFIYKKYSFLGSPVLVQRAWRSKYHCSKAPSHTTILRIAKQFEKTGSVIKLHSKKRNTSLKRKKAKIFLAKVMTEKPSVSIRKASQIAEISYSLTRLVLKDDLGLKPYKQPDLHEIKPADYPKRLDFCMWFKSLPKVTILRLICSDEAYFYLTETVNKQNNRLWLKTRPTNGVERPLYDQKVLVWCAMSSERIYGPYFFDSTVTEERYISMLKFFFWPKVVREDYTKYYFQQDGASPHRGNKVQKYLKGKFGDKFIDKNSWPPRSPDLNPCDFFLWGYLKSRVYNPLPNNLDELKDNIIREIKKIDKKIQKDTFLNFSKRCDLVVDAQGGHNNVE